ncbi:hypothetical protein Q1695_003340 [Nippostrongylus brasiliensis]|nr:hypothetical protein Q1695_003340 [Nippostrongylus brasiliensis]
MGSTLSRLGSSLCGRTSCQVVLVGLDNAGKTTALCKLKSGDTEIGAIYPSTGINMETLLYRNVEFKVWDVGGQQSLRELWKHHFPDAEGIIYIVDSTDRRRIDQCKEEIHAILQDTKRKGIPFLMLANKQDLPDAMTPEELKSVIGLDAGRDLEVHIQPSCAAIGEGLKEGVEWLYAAIMERR